MRRSAAVVAAILAASFASGCRCRSHYEIEWSGPGTTWYYQPESEESQPALGLPASEVASALDAASLDRAAKDALAEAACAEARRDGSVSAVASAVRECYRLGARDVAHRLIVEHESVYEWQDAVRATDVSCRYVANGNEGVLELTVARKPGVDGALAVCFPPGTYGVEGALAETDGPWVDPKSDRKYHSWPHSRQDLGMLRAPVIELEPGQEQATVAVPVACASFGRNAPSGGEVYSLRAFETGSPSDKLLLALCAGERAPEAEAQMALWLARNDITWDQFRTRGGASGRLLTFTFEHISAEKHAQGAAKLLLDAGVDPRATRFFQDSTPRPEPRTEQAPERAPASSIGA